MVVWLESAASVSSTYTVCCGSEKCKGAGYEYVRFSGQLCSVVGPTQTEWFGEGYVGSYGLLFY